MSELGRVVHTLEVSVTSLWHARIRAVADLDKMMCIKCTFSIVHIPDTLGI